MCFEKRKIPKHLILEGYSHQHKRRSHTWLCFAFLLLLGSMLISLAAEASYTSDLPHHNPASSQNYEAHTGSLIFKNQYGKDEAMLHVKTQVDVEINGLIAHVSLVQTFSNHTADWQEAVYLFPLPENAAVNYMEMRIGERVIAGEIKRKQEARTMYQQAKQAGKRAALTEQQRPNLFTQRVANIPPGETIQVKITYIHTNTFEQGVFAWRFPMTITPRYFPSSGDQEPALESTITLSQSGWATGAAAKMDTLPLPASLHQFNAAANSPHAGGPQAHNPVSLNITLNTGLDIQSITALYHDIHIEKIANSHRIRFKNPHENMDRDFVLQWQAVASQNPQAAIFSEEIAGEHYSLLMLVPPQKKSAHPGLARDLVFVIDVSGSMAGTSIIQAKSSLKRAVAQLHDKDRFNIIAFSDNYSLMTYALEPATPQHIAAATRWIDQLQANGGTAMHAALTASFVQLQSGAELEEEALQQIVFITDGAVGNEAELFRLIQTRLGNARLFPVAIGSAPNSYFMKKAAEFGRGSAVHIGDVTEVDQQIGQLFTKLNNAASKHIQLSWPGDAEIYPSRLPDLYFSEPLLIAVKSGNAVGTVEVSGSLASARWRNDLQLTHQQQAKGVGTVWARAKIENLEDLKIAGGKTEELKEEITEIALTHKLLSRYTSFIALEEQASRPAEALLASTPMQNALPHGHSAVNYPRTATNAGITAWIGLFSATLLVLLRRMRKD